MTKRIALIFYGLKPLDCVQNKQGVKDNTITHWKRNVIDQNKGIDVFIHSWSLDYKDTCLKNYQPKKHLFEKQKQFNKNTNSIYNSEINKTYGMTNMESNRSRYYSMQKSINLMKQYENEHKFKYDVVMISRMDLIWFTPINLNIDNKYFYTSHWNYAYDKNKYRQLKYKELDVPLDHYFICNSNDANTLSNIYNVLDKYFIHENPHFIIQQYCKDSGIWNRHRNIFHKFFDHLLLRTVYANIKISKNNNKGTDEWNGYDSSLQKTRLLF